MYHAGSLGSTIRRNGKPRSLADFPNRDLSTGRDCLEKTSHQPIQMGELAGASRVTRRGRPRSAGFSCEILIHRKGFFPTLRPHHLGAYVLHEDVILDHSF